MSRVRTIQVQIHSFHPNFTQRKFGEKKKQPVTMTVQCLVYKQITANNSSRSKQLTTTYHLYLIDDKLNQTSSNNSIDESFPRHLRNNETSCNPCSKVTTNMTVFLLLAPYWNPWFAKNKALWRSTNFWNPRLIYHSFIPFLSFDHLWY